MHKPNRRNEPSALRILLVAPSLDILGGQAVQAARLLAHLKQDASVKVAFLPINPRLPGPLRWLQRIKFIRTLATSLAYVASLLLHVYQYDIIHIFSASYFSFVLAPTPAILIAKLYGKKVILNYRSGEAEDHLQRWGRTAIPTIRLADRVVVPSGYLVDVFARFGLGAQAVFCTINTDQFRFRERRSLRPIFLSNRNFEPLYNIGCILRAFALIQQRYPEARLILAGDGSQRGKLEDLAHQLSLANVEFIGRVAQEKMPALYESTDIFLNSPNIDNMPGSIIEAFASGLPVVTTNAGGIPYMVTNEKTGLMVERGDFQAMAACALRLLENEAFAAEMAARACAECQRYSWVAIRKEWLKLYGELGRKSPLHQGVSRYETKHL